VARTLTAEFARHHGPKRGLLIGVGADSPVLDAAIDAVLPGDSLTVVAASDAGSGRSAGGAAAHSGGGAAAQSAGGAAGRTAVELRAHVAALGSWISDRVTVVESIAEADPADVLIVGEPLTGTADDVRGAVDGFGKYLAEGGVLVMAAPLVGGAAVELDRQAALFGVGSDLVLRSSPPMRVHRLRFTAADPAVAARLAPAYRTSSVPLTRGMHIDSNGVAAAGITLGLAALSRAGRPNSRLWLLPALAAPAVAAFFRDPERIPPDDESAVVAASDGKVLSVERVRDDRFGEQRDFLRIAVFLSVLDVHVNRAPVAGRVVDYFVTDGGFAAAMKPQAEHNVAAYTVLDTSSGTVVVAQRTGLIARRIVQRAPVGALLARGERFGLIRFGSRTDVYLPAGRARATVAPGDRVAGGASVLAHWL
jgi:phosphatidylserine decarboxylase